MKINIRRAGEEDFPALMALIKELAEYERSPDAVPARWNRCAGERLLRCFVAESTDRHSGHGLIFLRLFHLGGKSIYLEDIIVSKQFRNGESVRL